MNIQIIVFDGADELDFIGPFEVLQMAASKDPEWKVSLVSFEGPRTITAAHGAKMYLAGKLGEPAPDVVVVPGGGWIDRSPQGARAEAKNRAFLDLLASLAREGVLMTSVCTGAMLLAEAGLLRGRRATTNHEALDELKAYGAEVLPERVVDDGSVVTAGGVTSGLDLALHLVERLSGSEARQAIGEALEYPPKA